MVYMAGPICRDFLDIIRDNIALALDVEQVTRYCRHAQSLHGVCSQLIERLLWLWLRYCELDSVHRYMLRCEWRTRWQSRASAKLHCDWFQQETLQHTSARPPFLPCTPTLHAPPRCGVTRRSNGPRAYRSLPPYLCLLTWCSG